MKAQRHAKIIELISGGTVGTQEELTELLAQSGFAVTQATVSRDIKKLNITKTPLRDGSYRYFVAAGEDTAIIGRLTKIFRESVTYADSAQNIVVIKTLPGLAPGACSALDSLSGPDIVGTIAGDDTAFLLMRTTEDAGVFLERIKGMLTYA
ncbi:MAG: arginine repressor [Oscillospiraceae bacterium]|nr:arginine repressor [Oscillospiraceae bacterium]